VRRGTGEAPGSARRPALPYPPHLLSRGDGDPQGRAPRPRSAQDRALRAPAPPDMAPHQGSRTPQEAPLCAREKPVDEALGGRLRLPPPGRPRAAEGRSLRHPERLALELPSRDMLIEPPEDPRLDARSRGPQVPVHREPPHDLVLRRPAGGSAAP